MHELKKGQIWRFVDKGPSGGPIEKPRTLEVVMVYDEAVMYRDPEIQSIHPFQHALISEFKKYGELWQPLLPFDET